MPQHRIVDFQITNTGVMWFSARGGHLTTVTSHGSCPQSRLFAINPPWAWTLLRDSLNKNHCEDDNTQLSLTASHEGPSKSTCEESVSATSLVTHSPGTGNLIIPGYTRATVQSMASEVGNTLLGFLPTSSAASKVITETIIRTVPHDYTKEARVQAREILSEISEVHEFLFATKVRSTAPWKFTNSSHCGQQPTGSQTTRETGRFLPSHTTTKHHQDSDNSLQSVASLAGASVSLAVLVTCIVCLL
jgi:hypothetical protein